MKTKEGREKERKGEKKTVSAEICIFIILTELKISIFLTPHQMVLYGNDIIMFAQYI